MSERDIRARLRAAFEELDRRAGRTVRKIVLPCALGAGLALGAGGCDGRATPGDASVSDAQAPADVMKADMEVDSGVLPPYMAPAYMAPPWDLGADLVSPPEADYAAPDPWPLPDAGR